MGRAPAAANCGADKELGLKKGAWTAEEDEKLVSFIHKNKGHGSWRTLPKLAGLQRCGKSCRLRWTNYLRPNIKRGNFSAEEEHIIIQLHAFMGNKWSSIASHLPGRTDNEVKNHWNTHLKKRLTKMGIDPTTHLPLQFIMPHNQDAANYYSLLNTHYQSSVYNTDDWQMVLLRRSLQLDPTIACHLFQSELARLKDEASLQNIAASSHASSWLRGLQQSQAPAYTLNDFMHAMNLQLQATLTASNSSLVNASEPLQPSHQYSEANDGSLLKELSPWGNEENHCLAASSTLHDQNRSTCSGGVPHASEGPVHTSACSMATPETCSSESTSQLVCDQLQLPDLLSSDETMPALPPSLELPDSYWNKMLNLLGPHVALDDV